MNPIRKKFDLQDQFPFDLVYKNTKHPQNELPDHFHDWFELVYVYHGTGRFFINQTFYEMNRRDIFLVPSNTIHRAFPSETNPVKSTALFFSSQLINSSTVDTYNPLRCFDSAKKVNTFKIKLEGEEITQIEHLLQQINTERSEQHYGYRQAILINLQHILLLLNRLSTSYVPYRSDNSPLIPLWMKEILPYIENNLHQDISLSTLSARVTVSAPHFSRVFKNWTGINITDYIVSKRILLAKEKLLTSDENIEVIASQCGFQSISYFYKTFKKLTGSTPTEYKRKYRF